MELKFKYTPKYFREKKKQETIDGLLDLANRENMQSKFTTLQNEISVEYNTKVLVVTSIDEDDIAAVFAKAMSEAYLANGSNVLLIDANLYNPLLKTYIQGSEGSSEGTDIQSLGEKNGAVFMKKETYPSIVYKSGCIEQLIKDNSEKYEHIIVLVPSIKEHKEIVLLRDVIDSVLLVTRRNVTKKGDIFYALSFCAEEKIPVSKTVILK